MTLDLTGDLTTLTRDLCDIPSVSGEERAIADAVEEALRALPHLEVLRDGDAVMARTSTGAAERVVVAGHLDTVPVADNLPTRLVHEEGRDLLWGRGTVDMKGGVAVQLAAAARLTAPGRDVTWVFYDQEEVESHRNGLGRLVARYPEWLTADLAVLCEPTSAAVEGGCNGTLRVDVRTTGLAAHSARAWRGVNAIHGAAPVLATLAAYEPRTATVDGLEYREGMSAVGIRGGIAGNVVPDECVVSVNFRFAPDRDEEAALAHVRELFEGYELTLTDSAPGARPGLDHPAARRLVDVALERTGRPPAAKQGWTDVARFAALGVPAVNLGPGDPSLAHADDERCPVEDLQACLDVLLTWLAER